MVRQVFAENGPMLEDRLHLAIAMQMYGHEESIRRGIE
jgi:hypothetical protein